MSKKPHSASADGEDVLIKDGISGFLNPAEMFKLRRLALLSRYTVEETLLVRIVVPSMARARNLHHTSHTGWVMIRSISIGG